MLSRWRKEYCEGKIAVDKRKKVTDVKNQKAELTKVKKLEQENKRLKKELNLLKKWQRFLAEEHQQYIDSSRSSKIN
jgi:transposase